MLVVNADDWGIAPAVTDRILRCCRLGGVAQVSAMVYMRDAERAADIARAQGIGTGLHLNLIDEYDAPGLNGALAAHQRRVAAFLKASRVSQLLYNPLLRSSFEYVFRAQWGEYERLYGSPPARVDGHHHMHLCMNMLLSKLIPAGVQVRKSFTFGAGDKGLLNRAYRSAVNRWLARRYRTTDWFFSIAPLDRERHLQIVHLSRASNVELMVHPGLEEEYQYLSSDAWRDLITRTSRPTTSVAGP